MIISGVRVHDINMDEAIDVIFSFNHEGKNVVVTPNLDHLVFLGQDPDLLENYNRSALSLVDGWPVEYFLKKLGYSVKGKVAGSDLFPKICEHAAKNSKKMFFLGGPPGVAEKAKSIIQNKFENCLIDTYIPPFGFENSSHECQKICDTINRSKPDFLFLALGSPKQEKWVYQYKENLPPCVVLCLGASLELFAGVRKRAPLWMRKCNCEWLYRLGQDPIRMFKRYILMDLPFAIRLWIKILTGKEKKSI